MRTPKRGDRCEKAEFSRTTYRSERICNVRHLEGTPPGHLVPVREAGRQLHTLLCVAHAGTYQGGMAVRRQRPKKVDAAQESLI